VYIINDVLHHIARKSVQDLHKAVQEVVVPIFLNAMKGETGDGLKKLTKVLSIWDTNNFLDSSIMQVNQC
jgi:calcium homeostasis ER protein